MTTTNLMVLLKGDPTTDYLFVEILWV